MPMEPRWRLACLLGAGLMLVTVSAAGCSGSSAAEQDTYSIAVGRLRTLVPGKAAGDEASRRVLNALFTGLVRYDPETAQPMLAMAESIESPDERHWTITIEKGWTFHNGELVTSENFVRAWNMAAYGPNHWSGNRYFSRIEGYGALNPPDPDGDGPAKPPKPQAKKLSGLKVVNDYTFELTLDEPFSQFPMMLGRAAFYPMPKLAFEDYREYGDFQKFDKSPVGNGPYEMAQPWGQQKGEPIELARYDDYAKDYDDYAKDYDGYGGAHDAHVPNLTFQPYANFGAAYADLVDGKVDVLPEVPSRKLGQAEDDFGDRIALGPGVGFTYLGFGLHDERFADPKLRRAVSMAIDRQQLVEDFFADDYIPAHSLVPPAVPGSRAEPSDDEEVKAADTPCGTSCGYHPRKARKLLEQASGFDGALSLSYGSATGRGALRAVRTMLKRNLGIRRVEFHKRQSTGRSGEYVSAPARHRMSGPFRLTWQPKYPSAHEYLAPLYSGEGRANYTGYGSDRVDTLIRKGDRADSIDAAKPHYHRAENEILEDMPVVPLWFERPHAAYTSEVNNVVLGPLGHIQVADVKES